MSFLKVSGDGVINVQNLNFNKITKALCGKRKVIAHIVIVMLSITVSSASFGFKTKTHSWIGMQAWNDVVEDGRVDIPPFGSYAVSEEVRVALRDNRKTYLIGNVGPDGFPDLISGQVAVHPGVENGWQTDDWLRHVLSEAKSSDEIAFALGYASHAAGDVFAHSHVNIYSGDAFDAFDGEIDVELRHVLLEAFIDAKVPDQIGSFDGINFGSIYDNVATSEEELPLSFISETLIMGTSLADTTVFDQYTKLNGKLAHLQLMKLYEGLLFALEGVVDQKLGEISWAVDAAILAYEELEGDLPLEYINITQAAAELGVEVCDLMFPDKSAILPGKKNVQLFVSKTSNSTFQLNTTSTEEGLDIVTLYRSSYNSGIAQEKSLGDWWEEEVWDPLTEAVVHPWCVGHDLCEEGGKDIREFVERNGEEVACALQPMICVQVVGTKEYCENSEHLANVHEEVTKWLGKYGLAYLIAQDLALLKVYLHDLQISSRHAAEQYIRTSAEISQSLMMPSGHPGKQNPLDLIQEWALCDGLVYVGVEHHVSSAGCEVAGLVVDILDLQSEIQSKFLKWQLQIIGVDYEEIEQDIFDEIERIKEDVGNEILRAVAGTDVQQIVTVAMSDQSDAIVNSQFGRDDSKKELLVFDNVVDRVSKEFDSSLSGDELALSFAPIYNAVILSKLSLLSGSELNRLARNAGVTGATAYGATLFPETPGYNILFDAIRNIDGNHQWLEYAPPYPREVMRSDNKGGSYGYGNHDGHSGFRLFQDDQAREKVFKKIFRGPLVVGVEKPALIGASEVLPSDYPYRPCASNPFPNGTSDKSCVVEWLIPVLHLLH